MGKELLEYDPVTKTATWHSYDHLTRKTHIKTVQDCADIVEYNKAKQNAHNSSRFVKKGDYYHFARVPNTVLHDWMLKYNLDYNRKEDMPKIEKLLMSNEYKYLRTVDKI